MTTDSLGIRMLRRSCRMLLSGGNLFRALASGFWLGVLRGERLDPLATIPYDTLSPDTAADFNQSGLHHWERRSIDEFFQECRSLVVAGAGGGRELLALRRRGFDVAGFDSIPELVSSAKRLLRDEGVASTIELAAPGVCPDSMTTFDGAYIGRTYYMLIRGRSRRVAFLKTMRERLEDGAPIFLAFHDRSDSSSHFRLTRRLANALRWLRRRCERVELGDHLDTESGFFHHHFTRDEIAAELREAGFELLRFSTSLHPHAVGRAAPRNVAFADTGGAADAEPAPTLVASR